MRLGLGQVVLSAPGDDVARVLDEVLQGLLERERLWPALHDGQHVDAERLLQRRHLPQVVLHHLRHRVLLQVDDHPHALAVRLVAHVSDAIDLLVSHQLRDLLHQLGLVHLVGDLRRHDGFAPALGVLLNLRARAHEQAAPPGAISLADSRSPADEAPRGEIRPRHQLDELVHRDIGLPDDGDGGGDNLGQVVRRYVGRHAHRDPRCPVYQQVGQAGGQYRGLHLLVVVIGLEVDRLLVDIGQELLPDLLHATLGVAVSCRWVTVDRTKLPCPSMSG